MNRARGESWRALALPFGIAKSKFQIENRLLKNWLHASTGLSMNGYLFMISTPIPFALRFSKGERRVFQQAENN
jgi:hypothetical protein